MKLNVESISSTGPVRSQNEDCLGFWQPEEPDERLLRGAISVIADGVGGQANGHLASRMAVELALAKFREADPSTPAKRLLKDIFNAANLSIYDAGMSMGKAGRMATTLGVCIFKNKQLFIGHVGDSRVYLVRQEKIERLTHDHSYTGLQVKLRLISDAEARASTMRSMLTRSLGSEPFIRYDSKVIPIRKHDRIVQCTDGLYCFVDDGEISEGVERLHLREICPYLVALAERRGADDNLSVQVIEVERLEEARAPRKIAIGAAAEAVPVQQNQHEVHPGDVLDSRFEIQDVLNRSGMASVFIARDRASGETVAVKVPHMQFESDPAFFSRFQREAEIGKALDHPNILRFVSVAEQSKPYIVTELLQGKTLGEILMKTRPLPRDDALLIASQICDALAHMHAKGVVHRDLKPQNVMICNDGSLRVMDFGIAKSAEMRRITFVGFSPPMGTPDYMAPEQVKGRRGDERTDIYALGAMLYEMLTGSVPFEGPNPFIVMNSRLSGDPVAPRQRNPDISPEIEEIILHAMEREPHRRFASAAAMKSEMDDTEKVRVTGRAERLVSPKLWKARWQGARLVVLSASIPLLLFGLALALSRCHHGH